MKDRFRQCAMPALDPKALLLLAACAGCTDQEPPAVRVVSPAPGVLISDSVVIIAEAWDNRSVAQVEFLVDDSVIGSTVYEPHACYWATGSLLDSSSHHLKARAWDQAANEATSAPVQVTVQNRSPVSDTARLLWRYQTGGLVHSTAVLISDDLVYIGSNDNHLYAFDLYGDFKWRYVVGGYISSSPIIDGRGRLYFGGLDGYLYALRVSGTTEAPSWSAFRHDPQRTGRVGSYE